MTPTLVLLLAVNASPALTLHLAPEHPDLIVGEPLRLALTWHAEQALELPGAIDANPWNYDYLQIWVNGPSGRQQYREIPPSIEERAVATTALAPGGEIVSELVLLYGARAPFKTGGYLFPGAGTYVLTVRYASDRQPSESNTIAVRVREPNQAERPVFDALKSEPNEIKLGGPKAQRLLEKHANSRYLHAARIAWYHERESRLLEQRDPETGEPLAVTSEQWSAIAESAYRRMSEELTRFEDWGAYEDIRLALLADYAKRAGDSVGAERARSQVLTRFPNSRVAEQIRIDVAKERTHKQQLDQGSDKPHH